MEIYDHIGSLLTNNFNGSPAIMIVIAQVVRHADDLATLRSFRAFRHQHKDVVFHFEDEAMVEGQG